ncbi:hypothetical protein [Paenibacillus pinihumi]|uniref:hypothetical protein n=1 Tax=Paenibacillus pinihumi TaxID=669462 RepID=UPI000412FF53|nr:hypothetical protein [Paenibacillus pinihumi]
MSTDWDKRYLANLRRELEQIDYAIRIRTEDITKLSEIRSNLITEISRKEAEGSVK